MEVGDFDNWMFDYLPNKRLAELRKQNKHWQEWCPGFYFRVTCLRGRDVYFHIDMNTEDRLERGLAAEMFKVWFTYALAEAIKYYKSNKAVYAT